MGRHKSDKKSHGSKKRNRHEIALPVLLGTISMNQSGFGFFHPLDEAVKENFPEVFIPAQYTLNAMDGDTVEITILPPRPGTDDAEKGNAGKVISIVERKRKTLVGEVLPGNKIRPLNKKITSDIELKRGQKGIKRGDWVEISLTDKDEGLTAKIIRSLGKSGTIQGDLDAVCAEFGLLPPYTDEENQTFSEITPREIEREDLTGLWTITIDPFDAKDFDDAMSYRELPDKKTVEIGVHISDVAAFVAPKSDLDKAAQKRGFTAYLPGRTLPMLPKTLTKKISLQLNQISNAHSVILNIEAKTGKIISYKRCHSLIKVDHCLNYQEVQKFIEHPKTLPEKWTKDLASEIKKLIKITNAMRKNRQTTEKFLDLAIPEVRIVCDENADKISGIIKKIQKEADFSVEECMLAANSIVGTELIEKNIPGLFRVHPMPDPEKLMDFSETIHDIFGFYPGDLTSRENCNNFLEKLPDDEKKSVILNLFLRSLPRASYKAQAEMHFGLGKGRYSHFTSPIRRYSDLSVHQQLWNFDLKQRLKSKETMATLAEELSAQEENNDNAYYSASDRLKLRYLQEKMDDSATNFYEGVISKINAAGLLTEIPDLGMLGMVRTDDLPGDFFRVGKNILKSVRGNKQFKVGDIIFLRLYEIDFAKGQAFFRISGH